MNTVTVKFFGQLTDITGTDEIQITKAPNTQTALEYLKNIYPKLKGMEFKMAIGHQIINQNTELKKGDVIACMPPFSGG